MSKHTHRFFNKSRILPCCGRLLFTFLLVQASSQSLRAQPEWESQLFPFIDGKYTIQAVNFADREWRLDDFSYVGYHLGQKGLGADVPCKNVIIIVEKGDITAALQTAIDQVGSGGGGVVRIPAGTFTMSRSVAVPYNNVSIEGAGSDQTVIEVPSNYAPVHGEFEGLFTFGKVLGGLTNERWLNQGPLASSVSTVVRRGDMHVDADDASSVNAGDWIVLQQFFWEDLVNSNSRAPNRWTPNSDVRFSFSYLRRVTGKDGNRVFIDAPIPWDLDPDKNPINIRFTDDRMKENLGLKGITFRFHQQDPKKTGRRPLGAAAYFEGVRNGWVYDVKVFNFPRFGFYARSSARITFLDCRVEKAQDYGGLSYGYGYLVFTSQNILIKRCHGEDTRHNFISSRALTSMLVQTQCVSAFPTEPDDTHHSFEHAILWDKHIHLRGNALFMLNRGDVSTGAYETLGSGVVWNFRGDGTRIPLRVLRGGRVYIKPSPDGQAMMIGANTDHECVGQHPCLVWDNTRGRPFSEGDRMLPNPGLQVGPNENALRNVLYEGLYQEARLQPESLYETQLANRLGTPPPDWAGCL